MSDLRLERNNDGRLAWDQFGHTGVAEELAQARESGLSIGEYAHELASGLERVGFFTAEQLPSLAAALQADMEAEEALG